MKTGRKKRILPILLLLLVCFGAIGLVFCCGSDLFHTITDSFTSAFSDRENQQDHIDAETPAASDQQTDPADSGSTSQLQDQSATPPLQHTSSPICDPAITEIQTRGELQLLTGGSMPIVYYLQSDERWGGLFYGSDAISTYGCGPTAMAMVVSTLTDTVIDPPSMAQWAADHGYWARRSGSYHSIVIGTAEAFGLRAESFSSRDPDKLREALFSGKLLVALMGPGHFTQSGHFIILRGVTLSGDILVADPGSTERSLTVWDAQLLLDELSLSTADGSPLWLISVAEGTNFE